MVSKPHRHLLKTEGPFTQVTGSQRLRVWSNPPPRRGLCTFAPSPESGWSWAVAGLLLLLQITALQVDFIFLSLFPHFQFPFFRFTLNKMFTLFTFLPNCSIGKIPKQENQAELAV